MPAGHSQPLIQLRARKPVRVLLASVGYAFGRDGNFGLPHLVSMGTYLRATLGAHIHVDIIDLDYEACVPDPRPHAVFDDTYDVVGLCCYSSYEFLKTYYLGVEIRRRNPGVRLVVGGYHPSARPTDFTGEDSPFDHAIVSEGEIPLARVVAAVSAGERLPDKVLGPELVPDLDSLPPFDWSLIARYTPHASAIGRQVNMHLSRGCPFRCVFCMEAAKGPRSWRAFSPQRSVAELQRLADAVDLRDKTLFLTDPLFGVRADWRREVLERITAQGLPVRKYWALSRADLLDDRDIEYFHRANFGLGFGMESGDPDLLRIIHKGGNPARYLDRFRALAAQASALGFPWGANMIVGHPGDTPERMRRSAAWVTEMLRDTPRPTGFVAIDPYRFYPGSPIDHNLADYQRKYGTHVHRERWWDEADLAFTSQWVDASDQLDYRERERLAAELFEPIARDLAQRYAYDGPAADYFRRSVEEQAWFFSGDQRIRFIELHRLWVTMTRPDDAQPDIREDAEIADILRTERARVVDVLEHAFGTLDAALRQALVDEPRERHAPESMLWRSAQDEPLPLGDQDGASMAMPLSSLEAYAINYSLLELAPGDRLLELGGGTGYGAAVAARIVGARGCVHTVEIDPALARLAERRAPGVRVSTDPSAALALADSHDKVLYSYALAQAPADVLAALPDGGRLLAPIGDDDAQTLTLHVRRGDAIDVSTHGSVRYIVDRAPEFASRANDSRSAV